MKSSQFFSIIGIFLAACMQVPELHSMEKQSLREKLPASLWRKIAQELPGDTPFLHRLARVIDLDDETYEKMFAALIAETEHLPLLEELSAFLDAHFKVGYSPEKRKVLSSILTSLLRKHPLAAIRITNRNSADQAMHHVRDLNYFRYMQKPLNVEHYQEGRERIKKAILALNHIQALAMARAVQLTSSKLPELSGLIPFNPLVMGVIGICVMGLTVYVDDFLVKQCECLLGYSFIPVFVLIFLGCYACWYDLTTTGTKNYITDYIPLRAFILEAQGFSTQLQESKKRLEEWGPEVGIWEATLRGSLEDLKKLSKKAWKKNPLLFANIINSTDALGNTILHQVIKSGNGDSLIYLLSKGICHAAI